MNFVKGRFIVALSCVKALQSVKFLSPVQITDFSFGNFLNIDEYIDITRISKTIVHNLSKT